MSNICSSVQHLMSILSNYVSEDLVVIRVGVGYDVTARKTQYKLHVESCSQHLNLLTGPRLLLPYTEKGQTTTTKTRVVIHEVYSGLCITTSTGFTSHNV